MINDETDTRGMYEYFASHALISDEVEAEIQKQCKFTVPESEESDECRMAGSIADYDTHGHIDIYAIYAPLCHNSNLTSKPKKSFVRIWTSLIKLYWIRCCCIIFLHDNIQYVIQCR